MSNVCEMVLKNAHVSTKRTVKTYAETSQLIKLLPGCVTAIDKEFIILKVAATAVCIGVGTAVF